MTSYNAITNPEVAPGAPASSSVATRLRDNPIAIAEGAPGAPRVVVPTALSTSETNTSKTLHPDGAGGVMWVIAGAVPGNFQAFTASGSLSIPVGTLVKVTVVGEGGGSSAGANSSVTDGTTTVTASGGNASSGGTGGSSDQTTASGGNGYTIPGRGGQTNVGGSYMAPPDSAVGWYGGAAKPAIGVAPGSAAATRVATFTMASGTLTVTVGTGGTGNDGIVIVEF